MRRLGWLAALLLLVTGAPARAADVAVPRARCDAGSLPETGLQGRVPLQDRQSGRSQRGYRCNLVVLGQAQGNGSSYVSASFGHCAYLPQAEVDEATRALHRLLCVEP